MSRCEPPQGTKPDTNHTLVTQAGGEQWANWNGKAWSGLGEGWRDLSPEDALKQGFRYKFAWGALAVKVSS